MISLIGSWLQPGYSAFSNYVRALPLGEHGWVQIASFLFVGSCLLLFASTVASDFVERAMSLAGPIVVAILGLGFLFSGPIVMEPPGTPRGAVSCHGPAHSILAQWHSCVFGGQPSSWVASSR